MSDTVEVDRPAQGTARGADSIEVLRAQVAAYRWAYQYLQERMKSLDRHGWAHDCDGEIEYRIERARK